VIFLLNFLSFVSVLHNTEEIRKEKFLLFKNVFISMVGWFHSVIPATWEAEIGRIMVRGQPRQKFSEVPSQPIMLRVAVLAHLSSQLNQRHK
jgi:hypothetical protein